MMPKHNTDFQFFPFTIVLRDEILKILSAAALKIRDLGGLKTDKGRELIKFAACLILKVVCSKKGEKSWIFQLCDECHPSSHHSRFIYICKNTAGIVEIHSTLVSYGSNTPQGFAEM